MENEVQEGDQAQQQGDLPPSVLPMQAPPRSTQKRNIIVLASIVVLALVVVGFLVYQNQQLKNKLNAPTTYEECIKTPGSILQESYPATCVTRDGNRFPQPLTDEEKQKLLPPDPTVGWKTHTNNIYNFSLKYPPLFSRIICPGEESHKFMLVASSNKDPIESPTCARDSYYALEFTPEEPVVKVPFSSDYQSEQETIMVDGIQAQKYIFTQIESTQGPLWYISLKVNKDGKNYGFIYHGGCGYDTDITKREGCKKTFDQILSTFKFLDNQTATANWKTYRNDKYGFTFKYEANGVLTESSNPAQLLVVKIMSVGQQLELFVQENKENLLLVDFIKKYGGQYPSSNDPQSGKVENPKTFNNFTGVYIFFPKAIRGQFDYSETSQHFYFQKDGLVFWVRLTTQKDELTNKDQQDFTQILSTFKFTK